MHRRHLLVLLAALPALARAQGTEPTAAQPELPKEKLTIVTRDGVRHEFNVEMATTPRQQQVGEMFRTSVPPEGGMLFVWSTPRPSPMWMENTLVPLDMVFINADGTIRSIAGKHGAGEPGYHRQPRPGACDVGTGGRHYGAVEHPGRRQGAPTDFRQCRLSRWQWVHGDQDGGKRSRGLCP